MPRVGLEPKTPMFRQAKTLHALDRATTVIGQRTYGAQKHQSLQNILKIGKTKTV
jgi:hypothetical protein